MFLPRVLPSPKEMCPIPYHKELAGRSGKAAGRLEIHSERLGEDGRKGEESSAAGFGGERWEQGGKCKAEGPTAAYFRPLPMASPLLALSAWALWRKRECKWGN